MKTNLLYQTLSSKKLSICIVAILFSISSFGYDITTTTTWNAAYFASNPPTTYGTWDATNKILTLNFTEDIIVKNNTTVFTITDGITVKFSSEKKLEVQQGATLIVNSGSSLTYNSLTGNYWLGVIGKGNSSEPQFDLSSASNVPEVYETRNANTVYDADQTYIYFDDVIVERAKNGVLSENGAIARVENSEFIDCETAYEVESYKHPTTPAVVNNLELRNASFISDCTISWENIINFSTTGSATTFELYYGIYIGSAYGIHIQGVSIANNSTLDGDGCFDRGTGIHTLDGNYVIHKSGTPTYNAGGDGCVTYDGTANTITDVSVGINITESTFPVPDPRVNVSVLETTITDTRFAIRAVNGLRILIKDCTIDMEEVDKYVDATNTCGLGYYGIQTFQIEQILIDNNIFTGTPLNDVPLPVDFVILDECKNKDNKVFKNTFTVTSPNISNATVFTGVTLKDNNSAVEVLCNTFDGMHDGIHVLPASNINTLWQNKHSTKAGKQVSNTFSNRLSTDLRNSSTTPITYRESNSNWSTIITSGLWSQIVDNLENSCPDFPCSGWPIGVGINAPTAVGSYTLYPNPANTTVNIEFNEHEFSGEIKLTDILGRVALQKTTTHSFSEQLNISHLAKGIYLIQLTDNEGNTSTQKIIVEN